MVHAALLLLMLEAANADLVSPSACSAAPKISSDLHAGRPITPSLGLVSRVLPVHTAVCNCTRDEGGPFEVGNQVLISSHRKLLWSKATVVNVAEKPEQEFGRHD